MNFRSHAFQPFCCFQFLNSPACLGSRFSPVRLFMAPWTVARQAPLSGGFPGGNTGVGCHARLLAQGADHVCLSPVLAGGSLPLVLPGKPSLSNSNPKNYMIISVRIIYLGRIQEIWRGFCDILVRDVFRENLGSLGEYFRKLFK